MEAQHNAGDNGVFLTLDEAKMVREMASAAAERAENFWDELDDLIVEIETDEGGEG